MRLSIEREEVRDPEICVYNGRVQVVPAVDGEPRALAKMAGDAVTKPLVRPAIIAALVLGLVSVAGAADLESKLQDAREQYRDANQAARVTLIAAIDVKIKEIASSGKLEAVQELLAQRKAFEEQGVVPASGHLKAAVNEHNRMINAARAAMVRALEDAIKDYTKGLQFEKAVAIKAELQQLGRDEHVDALSALRKAALPVGWKLTDGQLRCNQNSGRGEVSIPLAMKGSYEMRSRFKSTAGARPGVIFVLPVGKERMISILLLSVDCRATRVFGMPDNSLPIDCTIMPNKTHDVVVKVGATGQQASLDITVDGRPAASWAGPYDKLRLLEKGEESGVPKLHLYESITEIDQVHFLHR